jgi:hypothetical protein
VTTPQLDVDRAGDGSLVLGLRGSWRFAEGIPSAARVRTAGSRLSVEI